MNNEDLQSKSKNSFKAGLERFCTMQLKFFTIPILSASNEEETINKFLRSVKVLEIKRDLVIVGENAYWTICILYILYGNSETRPLIQRGKIDYKDILTDEQFKRFCQLRKVRKQISEEDAVPAFAVFTDMELSEISKLEEINCGSIKQINGIGIKKLEKYGLRFCELINQIVHNEEGG